MDERYNNGFNSQDNNGQDYTQQYNQQNNQDYAQQYNPQYGQQNNQDYAQMYNQHYNSQNNQYNQQYGQQAPVQPQPYTYNDPYTANQPNEDGKGMAIASLVLSIVSFFCCGSICSILGLVFGIISKKKQPENNGMAVAGIVISTITLALSIIFGIIYAIIIASAGSAYLYY